MDVEDTTSKADVSGAENLLRRLGESQQAA
jgi:hypothetical protein